MPHRLAQTISREAVDHHASCQWCKSTDSRGGTFPFGDCCLNSSLSLTHLPTSSSLLLHSPSSLSHTDTPEQLARAAAQLRGWSCIETTQPSACRSLILQGPVDLPSSFSFVENHLSLHLSERKQPRHRGGRFVCLPSGINRGRPPDPRTASSSPLSSPSIPSMTFWRPFFLLRQFSRANIGNSSPTHVLRPLLRPSIDAYRPSATRGPCLVALLDSFHSARSKHILEPCRTGLPRFDSAYPTQITANLSSLDFDNAYGSGQTELSPSQSLEFFTSQHNIPSTPNPGSLGALEIVGAFAFSSARVAALRPLV
ncbi:hypothetical protein J3F83DRAFT_373390 [Trichoderma novae-zelandiae]